MTPAQGTRKVPRRAAVGVAGIVGLLGTLIPSSAHAVRFYWELGLGGGWISNASTLLGNTSGLSPGLLMSLGLGFTSASDSRDSSVQFAVQGRSVAGSTSSQHLSILTGYPLVRLTTRRLSLELGASPLVYTRVAPLSGISNFSKASGTLAGTAALAYETLLNPQASVIWSVGAEGFRSSGVIAPWPIYEASATLRVFIGGNESFSRSDAPSRSTGDEYKGWRYPFGRGL